MTGQRRRGLAIAAGLSLALHGALLVGLWLDRPPAPPPEPPVFELSLVRPPRPDPPELTEQPPARPEPADGNEADITPPRPAPRARAPLSGGAPIAAPFAPVQSGPGAFPFPPTTPPPFPAEPPSRPPPTLGDVLRAENCSDRDRLTRREREACQERLGRARAAGPVPPTAALQRALTAADDARARANRRLGESYDDPDVAQCAGSGLCRRELKGVPFGSPPPALPVIPPSTLRGDDDALRPRPRP